MISKAGALCVLLSIASVSCTPTHGNRGSQVDESSTKPENNDKITQRNNDTPNPSPMKADDKVPSNSNQGDSAGAGSALDGSGPSNLGGSNGNSSSTQPAANNGKNATSNTTEEQPGTKASDPKNGSPAATDSASVNPSGSKGNSSSTPPETNNGKNAKPNTNEQQAPSGSAGNCASTPKGDSNSGLNMGEVLSAMTKMAGACCCNKGTGGCTVNIHMSPGNCQEPPKNC